MSMPKVSPTLRVLTEIREELRTHRDILKGHGGRLDRLEHGQEVMTTEITKVAYALHGVAELLRERLNDRDRIDNLDRRVTLLERRPRKIS